MAPRSSKEATIIVLDVGENTLVASGKSGTSFFQRAKNCASKIVQKKIFAKPNDEVALILMGSDNTQNDLNKSLSGFNNIVEMESLQMPSWSLVRALDQLEMCDFSCDWVDALVVALNFAKNETQAKKFGNVRVLLITNFITETSDSNIDVIINALQQTDIELVAISDCIEHTDQMKNSQFSQNPVQSNTQTKSQRLFDEVIKQVGGYLCHIDLAEAQLLTFQKKTTNPMPWNTELSIGSKLKIHISAYLSIQSEKFLAPFKTECAIPNTVTKMVTEYAQNNQLINKPDEDETIKSYMYGSTLVALVNDPKFTDTKKCLSCLGFTKRQLVLKEYLCGEGCHVVLPRKDLAKSAKVFMGLVQAMIERDMVMIARKVYNNKNKPTIVALLPTLQDNIAYFTMIQLAFANDISLFSFPNLVTKKTEPSKEQQKVVDELVSAMDLMDAIDDGSGLTEAFALETSLNPVNQHLCRSVAHRALKPTDPLPTIDPELIAMIEVPPKVKKSCADILEELEKQFPIELVERRVKKIFGKGNSQATSTDEAMDEDTDTVNDDKIIVAIGTVTPAEDFGILLKKGERFGNLADQIQTVIYDLIFRTASLQSEKILECIMMYREQSKIYGPFSYNNWIKELKKVVTQRNRSDFWQEAIVKEGFGLITVNEAPISTVTIEEQLEFYELSSKDTNQVVTMDQDDEDDLDALLG